MIFCFRTGISTRTPSVRKNWVPESCILETALSYTSTFVTSTWISVVLCNYCYVCQSVHSAVNVHFQIWEGWKHGLDHRWRSQDCAVFRCNIHVFINKYHFNTKKWYASGHHKTAPAFGNVKQVSEQLEWTVLSLIRKCFFFHSSFPETPIQSRSKISLGISQIQGFATWNVEFTNRDPTWITASFITKANLRLCHWPPLIKLILPFTSTWVPRFLGGICHQSVLLIFLDFNVPYMAFNYMLSCSCHAPCSLLFWYNLH